MAQPTIQSSFNSGEWAPQLFARVDQEKYHSGAALLRNFFVDYRGGASTRTGTKYILQAYKSATAVRLIPFQASFTVGYVLEFGDQYIRFYNNGAPVLEAAITGGTAASGHTFTIANTLVVGDWVYATGWGGMTNVNGRYFIVSSRTAGTVLVTDLYGNTAVFTGTYTSGGQLQRVYTLPSPFAAADLATLKYAQNVTTMVLCHPSYSPYILTLVAATNWTLTAIVFGSTVSPPTNLAATSNLGAGSYNYTYVVTSVDNTGQESGPTSPVTLASLAYLGSTPATNSLTWTAASGATSYNVYKAIPTYGVAVASGAQYGFIGNTTSTSFNEPYPSIGADFTLTPPIPKNPFQGAGVQSLTLGTNANYTAVPSVTIAAPSSGLQAVGHASLKVSSATVSATGNQGGTFAANPSGGLLTMGYGVVVQITGVAFTGTYTVTQVNTIISPGSITSGSAPASVTAVSCDRSSPGDVLPTLDFIWNIGSLILDSPGAGYTTVPAVSFSSGAATATAALGPASAGNPSVPAFFQQRLVLAGPSGSPQAFYMSQPGAYYNYNISNPVQGDDAITGTVISGQLSNIKSMIPQTAGLLVLTDGASWLINGGSAGSAVTPASIVANAQSFNGANDVPPLVSNYDVLYVQSKGSSVRDSTYNFYANVFTGTDITILSSHLFYGFHIHEWCWAEEPYKVVWAVRSDGELLSCTFMKEQEFVGWAHHDTNGLYKSVATIIETTPQGDANAVYTVVQRTVQGQTLQYIERFADRYFPNGVVDAWCVDAGLQYDGTPATSFSGGEHLAGLTCTGLADGIIIPAFVMPTSGNFTLSTPASKVTVGLAFTPQLQTLPIDLGPPTVQSKVKKIPAVTVRVAQTLGLQIGSDSTHLTPMKDLIRGNVSGMLTGQTSQVITDLTNGDALTQIDPTYTVPGQYFIEQSYPYPASILGVIPQVIVGDSK